MDFVSSADHMSCCDQVEMPEGGPEYLAFHRHDETRASNALHQVSLSELGSQDQLHGVRKLVRQRNKRLSGGRAASCRPIRMTVAFVVVASATLARSVWTPAPSPTTSGEVMAHALAPANSRRSPGQSVPRGAVRRKVNAADVAHPGETKQPYAALASGNGPLCCKPYPRCVRCLGVRVGVRC